MIWPIIKAKLGVDFSKKQTVSDGIGVFGENNTVFVVGGHENKPLSDLELLIQDVYKFLEENTVKGSQCLTLSEIYKNFETTPKEQVYKAMNILLNRRQIKEPGMGYTDETRGFWVA